MEKKPVFDLKICTIDEAPGLHDAWATSTLSLIDRISVYRNFPLGVNNNKVVYFDDLENEVLPDAPTRDQIAAALEFTAGLKQGDRFLCHCHAGVSRSPAMAIAVLVQHGDAPVEAIARVERVSALRGEEMWPNALVLRYADDILGSQGRINQAIARWKSQEIERAQQRVAELELYDLISPKPYSGLR
ncbi:hypothetical protein SAE02_61830 [Skermanella aerolata]|uniref:Tyrosine specific protein phosphatases domain-containing protein n=1 Tax=Skermanella aerolata TaxID=393310 RepID=A0A512E022_9PROT|nr:dual specificity protein phosphatase family protein [Skermanella aerolata]KJB91857.1 hypothetical protein N826_25410 [Skermanella aerolata KACC 11604]GEO42035.1 hypothetical protein SAE02_61830 [Skermanella aerolata]